MFSVTPLAIPDLLEVVPQRHGDDRGWLAETWNRARFSGHGINHLGHAPRIVRVKAPASARVPLGSGACAVDQARFRADHGVLIGT